MSLMSRKEVTWLNPPSGVVQRAPSIRLSTALPGEKPGRAVFHPLETFFPIVGKRIFIIPFAGHLPGTVNERIVGRQ